MSAGLTYADNVILGDYPCDIQSIVRFRGGFTFCSDALMQYDGFTFPPFIPLCINLVDRTVYPCLSTYDVVSAMDITDENTTPVTYGFLYNSVKVEAGASVTVILKADEISIPQLQNLQYIDLWGNKMSTIIYDHLTEISEHRTKLFSHFSNSTFVWE